VPDDRADSQLDTMLLLRRVPLFAGLEPEDLQRIASVAMERDYPAGTPLVRQGDVGDELIVLVTGSVRVLQTSDGGEERFIRRYSAGEHIGELAILRDRPRVATVMAEDDVRGLVLGGDGLRAILRERPEAAMAMLATLAERLSTQ
jgi:CRP-like cAMP-binding protein